MINLIKKIYYKILWYSYLTWVEISWNDWNPWRHASLNLAWERYKKTPMYEDRVKIDFMPVEEYYENYAEQAYNANREYFFFRNMFTWKDKLKIIFMPFSCGTKYGVNPIAKFKVWWYGIEMEDIK